MIIDTFICDYGGVVADHYCEPYQGQLAALLGTTRKDSRELVSEKSTQGRLYRLDQLSKSEFWKVVVDLAGKQGLDEDLLQELWARTYIPNAAVLSLLGYLKNDVGVQTGIVMNEDRFRYQFILENYDLEKYASVIVASYEVGTVKPERAFYEVVLKKCHRTGKANRVIYIDDRQTHVDAAIACGMQGYVYINAGDLNCFVDTLRLIRFEP